jgi:hypothetical protein
MAETVACCETMQRTIVPDAPFMAEPLAPGVTLRRLHPGGLSGPNREVGLPTPGGQTWSESIMLGTRADPFQMLIPDIRLPANQLWPLHWHDCWTLVLVLEGTCCIGDWWMGAGEVFIAAPELEYGPLLIGPGGCRMFEIFARAHLSPGGYAPEYRDHPTLQHGQRAFRERSAINRRNDGRQVMPTDGVEGFFKDRLRPGARWDLGEGADRAVVADLRLKPGEALPAAAKAGDWLALIMLGGTLELGGRTLTGDDCLIVEPGATPPAAVGSGRGAHLLVNARTATGWPAETGAAL